MKNYIYSEFVKDISTLHKQLQSHPFDTIVAITRGGMTLAQALAHALNIRNVQTIQAISYNGSEKLEKVELIDNTQLQKAKQVLIVDDIADSGDTLDAVITHLLAHNPHITCKTCTLFYKKSASIMPDFTCNEAKEWINFFWERDFTINS